MTDWNGFKGAAKRIEDIDIPRIGHKIGVGEDELHAFMDVEAAGSGFDGMGRPKMLFEPHIFYRNLSGAKRTQAVNAGLAYAKWKSGAYPKDSYPRLVKAMAIDETAALKSASWGLGQVLGENHKMIGFATPQAMVRAFMDDEEKHLEAIVDFLKAAKLDDNLRAHDWAGVAKGYNGPSYAKHNYHGRMAAAYAKWRKIKDTPWTSAAPAPKPAPVPVPISDKETLKRVQQQLIDLGYPEVGGVDGLMGTKTRGAIAAFRIDNDMPVSDAIDDAFLTALASAPHRKIAPERADATAADLRTKGSSIISASDVQVVAGGAAGVGTVAAGAIDAVGALSDAGDTVTQITDGLTPFQSLLAFFASYWWIAALIIIAVVIWQAIRIRRARVADHRSGNTGVVGMDRKGA